MAGLFDGTPLQRPVTCARCERALTACACPRGRDGTVLLPSQQAARVRREKRRDRMVTVVSGLDPSASDLPALLKQFKLKFGAGGSVVDGTPELQGDHRDAVVQMLAELGYPAKAAGG